MKIPGKLPLLSFIIDGGGIEVYICNAEILLGAYSASLHSFAFGTWTNEPLIPNENYVRFNKSWKRFIFQFPFSTLFRSI